MVRVMVVVRDAVPHAQELVLMHARAVLLLVQVPVLVVAKTHALMLIAKTIIVDGSYTSHPQNS